jgi:hypothetical protein
MLRTSSNYFGARSFFNWFTFSFFMVSNRCDDEKKEEEEVHEGGFESKKK